MWITSIGLLFNGSAQMLQERMNGAVFDVGRVSWFQRGLLNGRFSSIVVHKNYKRREFVQSWWGKEFLCSNVVFYIKTSSWLFCTDVTREESLTREDFSNPSEKEERLFNNFNHNIWLLLILLFFGHVGRCGCFSGVLWWRSVHFCLNKCYKITSSSCVKLFMCIILRFLYEIVYF